MGHVQQTIGVGFVAGSVSSDLSIVKRCLSNLLLDTSVEQFVVFLTEEATRWGVKLLLVWLYHRCHFASFSAN